MITKIKAFSADEIPYYSCFISYSHSDKLFAHKLYDYLQENDILCWLDDHEILPGDDLYQQIDRGIRGWDKVLLCCSKDSLSSWWVDNEINTAFDKEQSIMNERGVKIHSLIPINLDDHIFSDQYDSGKKSQILSRFVADFTGWEINQGKFEKEIKRIMKALIADESYRKKVPSPKL